eukprot:4584265-Pyramimonas_sp.AAC.1
MRFFGALSNAATDVEPLTRPFHTQDVRLSAWLFALLPPSPCENRLWARVRSEGCGGLSVGVQGSVKS